MKTHKVVVEGQEGFLIGAKNGEYLVEINGSINSYKPKLVHLAEDASNLQVGDPVVIRHRDGNKILFSKGTVKKTETILNNLGEREPQYHVEVGTGLHIVKGEDVVSKMGEAHGVGMEYNWEPQYGDFDNFVKVKRDPDVDDNRKNLSDAIKKVYDAIQNKFPELGGSENETLKRQIGPALEHFVDGHTRIKTGTPNGDEGHAIFKPTGANTMEMKQLMYTHPDATPWKQEDLTKPEHHHKDIADNINRHLHGHYSKLKDRIGKLEDREGNRNASQED